MHAKFDGFGYDGPSYDREPNEAYLLLNFI